VLLVALTQMTSVSSEEAASSIVVPKASGEQYPQSVMAFNSLWYKIVSQGILCESSAFEGALYCSRAL